MKDTLFIKNNFFILTGGPGSGKTSVLEALQHCGYLAVPEVGRAIIKDQQSLGGNATHTGDRITFCDLMLKQSVLDYKKYLTTPQTVFFDRGIPDLYGYAKRFCNGITEEIEQATTLHRYNPTVFLFPPWPEIYTADTERKQDFNEAQETYLAIKEAYQTCNYHLIEIPKVTVNERVEFILQRLIPLQITTVLTTLSNEINQLLGFHEDIPRINYGPCGVFAQLFFEAWNKRFKDKVHICFIMTKVLEECDHIAIRLSSGAIYDGGLGIHHDTDYNSQFVIKDMLNYDHALLEKWSYGLDRTYPRFCPDFDKEVVRSIINKSLDQITI